MFSENIISAPVNDGITRNRNQTVDFSFGAGLELKILTNAIITIGLLVYVFSDLLVCSNALRWFLFQLPRERERMEEEYDTEILKLCEEIAVLEAEKETFEREVSMLHGQYLCSVL